ncbi:MAG: molybdenum cofactor guanylyltransferase [Chloroflexota bacterium]|nr:molybdenum cofactor guanylyltransferase [Chloroflexota bacterium]
MLTIVIQAGGQSSRMGQDKALMLFLGYPLIERVLNRVLHLADEVMITTNHASGYRYLNIPLIPDEIPNRGALGGLYTALKAAQHPLVAVVACDMPFVNAEILSAARDILTNTQADAVIPYTEAGLEPLHAVYRRATCLPAVKAAIEAGKWRAISWHADVDIHILPPEELRKYDPRGITFENVNTPEELRQAEELV